MTAASLSSRRNKMGALSRFFDKMVFKSKHVLKKILDAIKAGLKYLTQKITPSFLKGYKKKKSSIIVLLNSSFSSIFNNINKEERTYTTDQLMKDETVMAEYDENTDEVVQANFASRTEKWSYSIDKALRQNDGLIFVKD
jgi:hypothetical protein